MPHCEFPELLKPPLAAWNDNMKKYTIDELKALAREAGIVGEGGAGFPFYAKLTEGAEVYILNCAECEPILKLHQGLLETHTREILEAMQTVVETVGAKRGVVAIKDHYVSTIEAVEFEIEDFPNLEIQLLPSVYPMGDELILVREVTGKTVQPGKLPISVGAIVNNVETVYNLYRAMNGEALTHKYVTVAGEVAEPKTVLAPIGARLSDIVALAGGATVEDPAYLVGGPMMGKLSSGRDSVTKTTNAIILLPQNHTVVMERKMRPSIMLRRAMSACCQCHSCTDLCSRNIAGYPIEPHMIMRILSNGGMGDVKAILGSFSCSGCGLCEAYACPQSLSPRLLINELKAKAKEMNVKPPQDAVATEGAKEEKLRRVSAARLTSRLGLNKYDVPAPITEEEIKVKKVRIPLDRYIGAPAKATVKVGDTVTCGEVIGAYSAAALSVNVHASVDGKVTIVNDKIVEITCK